MAIVWIVLGIGLLAFEMHHLAFYALFVAIGAFAAAGVAAVFPGAIVVQLGVAVATTTVGILAVRPYVSQFVERRHDSHVALGVHGGLVGQEVVTLDVVGDQSHPGHVRLAGERWLAQSGGEGTIPAGVRVVVTAVRGTTLVVWPVEHFDHELPPGANGGAPS